MNTRKLERLGLRILHVWEHSLKARTDREEILTQIRKSTR